MKNPKNICGGFFGGVSRKRRVWGGNPNKYLTGGQMSKKRNLVHWSILALRNCRIARCRAAFNTFSAAGGDFANSAAIFPAHILPTCKGAVCCTPAFFSFIERIKEGICPASPAFPVIERMKRGFLPAGGAAFFLSAKDTKEKGFAARFLYTTINPAGRCSARSWEIFFLSLPTTPEK